MVDNEKPVMLSDEDLGAVVGGAGSSIGKLDLDAILSARADTMAGVPTVDIMAGVPIADRAALTEAIALTKANAVASEGEFQKITAAAQASLAAAAAAGISAAHMKEASKLLVFKTKP